MHESKFPFVSRIEFIRSKLSNFSAHVYGVSDTPGAVRGGRGRRRSAQPSWPAADRLSEIVSADDEWPGPRLTFVRGDQWARAADGHVTGARQLERRSGQPPGEPPAALRAGVPGPAGGPAGPPEDRGHGEWPGPDRMEAECSVTLGRKR